MISDDNMKSQPMPAGGRSAFLRLRVCSTSLGRLLNGFVWEHVQGVTSRCIERAANQVDKKVYQASLKTRGDKIT